MDAVRPPCRPPAAAPAGEPGPGRLRLVCLPQAGGDAASFDRWLPHLPDGCDLVPLTAPAGPPPADFGEWAERLLPLAPAGPAPFALFGHGTGGLLAYEIARRLARRGGPLPAAVLVSGSRAPHVPAGRLAGLVDDAALLDRLLEHGALPLDLLRRRERLADGLTAIRQALTLAEDYVLEDPEPLECPLHVFGGIADRLVPGDTLNDWRRCAGSEFSATVLPGGHAAAQTDPESLLASVGTLLGDAVPTGAGGC